MDKITNALLGVLLGGLVALPAAAAEAGLARRAAASSNAFGLDLYTELCGEPGNVFLSPASIELALGMTAVGARGETVAQMVDVLELERLGNRRQAALGALNRTLGADRAGVELSLANALWGQRGEPFKKPFLTALRQRYGAGLRRLDFRAAAEAARRTINAWVAEKTRQKIRDLLQPGDVDADTRLVLTNAIYFKGEWRVQFDPERTTEQRFRLGAGKSVTVPMMRVSARFAYAERDGLQLLELPYRGGELGMVVALPAAADGLAAVEDGLDRETLDGWLAALDGRPRQVRVVLPRFEIQARYQLARPLIELGMRLAFGSGADFSGMSELGGLYIAKVIHKTFIKVDEQGSEAAAATAVVMTRGIGAKPQAQLFRADRPFLFLIRDRTSGAVLFLGRLANPAAEASSR